MRRTPPVEDGSSEASIGQKIDGLVAQMRADIEVANIGDGQIVRVLRERLHDAGIVLDDLDFAELLDGVRAKNGEW